MTTGLSNLPLAKPLRSQLENTVKAARDVAEKGAKAALAQLAVGEAKVPDYLMSDDLKSLRRRLRAHGRALGDAKAKDDTQTTQHIMWEVAYGALAPHAVRPLLGRERLADVGARCAGIAG